MYNFQTPFWNCLTASISSINTPYLSVCLSIRKMAESHFSRCHLIEISIKFPSQDLVVKRVSTLWTEANFDQKNHSMYEKNDFLLRWHYSDVIMSAMASQITGVTIVDSTVCSGADQRKHQSSASLAFVRGNDRWFPAQRTRNADNVLMTSLWCGMFCWLFYSFFKTP